MDDYLTERDQWEALKTWLRENGAWIVAGVLLGAAILYGWRWWQERTTTESLTAAARYADVVSALDRGDQSRAAQLTEQLHADFGDTPYADQGELALARVNVETGELEEAAKRLRRVMNESQDESLRHVARLRLARVEIAQGKPDEALKTLGGVKPGAFDPRYAEVRGDALLARGDRAGALAEYRKALEATEPGLVDTGLLQLKINDLAPPDAAPSAKPQDSASPSQDSAK